MRLTNAAGILACVVTILGLTMYVSPMTLPSIAPVRASTRAISLVATFPNWNMTNPTITVTKGDTITISLSSNDGSTHQLLIDFDGEYAGGSNCTTVADQCSSNFSPSTPTQIPAFTITSDAGTYKYYCTIHYPNVQGLFIVQNPALPNFTINPSQTSLTVAQDSSGTISIALTSVNGFSGTINLSATVSRSGPQASINPASVTLTSGGSASSTLTVSTAASTSGYYSTPTPVSQGNYLVNVTASSGSLSHSTPVSLTVGSTNSAPPGSSSLPLLPIAGGVIAVVAVIGTALFLRKRKH